MSTNFLKFKFVDEVPLVKESFTVYFVKNMSGCSLVIYASDLTKPFSISTPEDIEAFLSSNYKAFGDTKEEARNAIDAVGINDVALKALSNNVTYYPVNSLPLPMEELTFGKYLVSTSQPPELGIPSIGNGNSFFYLEVKNTYNSASNGKSLEITGYSYPTKLVKTSDSEGQWSVWVRYAFENSNVASATKLATAQNLTVGRTAKSFDGSVAVSWTTTEILPTGTSGQVLKHNGTDWIAGADNNTSYPTMSPTDANAGTATTASVITAATLKEAINTHSPVQTTITGNAGSATKLITARTINDTNFDGSANITTANWGTARNLTVGSTAKSVNGSANVSWSLNEILPAGAANQVIRFNGTNWVNGALESADIPTLSATKAQMLSGTNNAYLSGSAYLNTITWATGTHYSGTVTLDLDNSLNHNLTIGGNVTMATPSNADVGKTGDIVLTLTANAVVSWNTNWKFLGALPNIGKSGEIWVISYKVLTSLHIIAVAAKTV